MRISTNELHNVLTAYLNRTRNDNQRAASTVAKGRRSKDSIDLSSEARQLSMLRAELDKLPETDAARVRELREQVEKGEYDVPADKIAEKLLARVFADRLAGAAEQE